MTPRIARPPKVLVVDIGGEHIKCLVTGRQQPIRFASGPAMTAAQAVDGVLKATRRWSFDVVSIGYPGRVRHGLAITEPWNLGGGWVEFDFAAAFKRPVKLINDAAMQALGSYQEGRMLFLGLGTGLGSAMIIDGIIAPMELAHLPYKKGRTYEDYLGAPGLKRLGKKEWRRSVEDVVSRFVAALEPDYVVLGGGNADKLKQLPPDTRIGSNADAFVGGFRLWER